MNLQPGQAFGYNSGEVIYFFYSWHLQVAE